MAKITFEVINLVSTNYCELGGSVLRVYFITKNKLPETAKDCKIISHFIGIALTPKKCFLVTRKSNICRSGRETNKMKNSDLILFNW